MPLISKAMAIYGIGDALNQRAFLVEYCRQKNIPTNKIAIYTDRHWWMFDGLGFRRGKFKTEFRGLTSYRNFGMYDLQRKFNVLKLDEDIAKNAGIDFSFDVVVPLPKFKEPDVELPKVYITFNTGFGDFSGKPGNEEYVCLKSWPKEYWTAFVAKIGVPCVQIGAGKSCEIIPGAINLVDKLTITESAEVMRKALYHVDMEGGLAILNQHMGKKSVVLFGATAIEQQGRSFNLNLSANVCEPCYEWKNSTRSTLFAKKKDLKCAMKCMTELKPERVIAEIKKWEMGL